LKIPTFLHLCHSPEYVKRSFNNKDAGKACRTLWPVPIVHYVPMRLYRNEYYAQWIR